MAIGMSWARAAHVLARTVSPIGPSSARRREHIDSRAVTVRSESMVVRNTWSNDSSATVIIQFGEQRTATEFQHTLLCAWAMLTFAGAPSRVSCPFWRISGPAPVVQGGYVYVIKTHRNLWNLSWNELYPKHRLSLFATAVAISDSEENDWRAVARRLSPRHAPDIDNEASPLKYVQILSAFQHQSVEAAVLIYMRILGFAGNQSADLLDYMSRWNVINRCCSRSMSRSEVMFLRWRTSSSPYTPGQSAASRTAPLCTAYNLDAEEDAFMSTRIVRLYGSHHAADIHASYVLLQRSKNETTMCRTLRAKVATAKEWQFVHPTKW